MGQTAASIGANVFQFFMRNPRGGAAKPIDMADVSAFLGYAAENGIGPILAHAPYTLNAASSDPRIRDFAQGVFIDDLTRLERKHDTSGQESHFLLRKPYPYRILCGNLRRCLYPRKKRKTAFRRHGKGI